MKLKRLLGFFALGLMPLLSACGDDDDGFSIRDQFEFETEKVDLYLADNGLSAEIDPNSGIRYIVNAPGDGISPYVVDSVTISYTTSIMETGEEVQTGENVKLQWGTLLIGPRVAMTFIQENGGSIKAFIPSAYAYGEQGTTGIPPNTTLIFDIVIHEVHARQLRFDMERIADYLEQNNLGAQVHPHGFSYVIVEPGSGENPTLFSNVAVNYEGRVMASGNVFDSGNGAGFLLADLIPGWQVGLPLIKQGGEIILYLPSPLAYGPVGNPPTIPENAPLIFDIELLTVL